MNSEPVKNITSEQILGDAALSHVSKFERPQQSIQDLDELVSYQVTKRREFEQQLKKNRLNFGQWLRYAKWEVDQNVDFERARSIYERALDVNVEHVPFWVQYIQFELLHKNVNHARNLLDRATTILPRVGKLWFLYVRTEEGLKNYKAVRNIFERWMQWHPDLLAWEAYLSFEVRYNELGNARKIFDRFVVEFPNAKSWLKYLDFELRNLSVGTDTSQTNPQRVRQVFEMAADMSIASRNILSDSEFPMLIKRWANWEASQKESARARLIYAMLLDEESAMPLTQEQRLAIKNYHIEFNKLHGDKDGVAEAISAKRAAQYEEQLRQNPRDYDVWWALLNLYESINEAHISETFKLAMLAAPLELHKSSNWKKFVMIGIRFALWLEYNELNINGARDTWKSLQEVIVGPSLSFAKIWIGLAEFEIRNNHEGEDGLKAARRSLGRGIGISSSKSPNAKIFRFYTQLETRLGEWNRVRKLYERWIELSLTATDTTQKGPSAIALLLEWISLEKGLGESERCIALYELGLQLYKVEQLTAKLEPFSKLSESYVDFYITDMAYSEAREVHLALTEQIGSPEVWISYAMFESSIPSENQLRRFHASEANETEFEFEIEEEHRRESRKVFEKALFHFNATDAPQEHKLQVLESWKAYEAANGDQDAQEYVNKKFPVLVRKRKTIEGVEQEYLEYEFPKDPVEKTTSAPGLSKFLANAKKWALENNTS